MGSRRFSVGLARGSVDVENSCAVTWLTKESRRNISEALKREFGEVYVVVRCPKCKHEIHLKAV